MYQNVDSIKNLKNFSQIWIDDFNLVKKDSVQKHLNGKAHKKPNNLEQRKTLGGAEFNDKVVKRTPIGEDSQKWQKKILRSCFNFALYLVKQAAFQ